jgi:uncharacterized protein (DUF4415 family)
MSKGKATTKMSATVSPTPEDAISKPSGKTSGRTKTSLKFKRVSADRVAKPEDVRPENVKIRITMYVDLDVLNHFKQMARSPDSAGYQTLMNAALRRAALSQKRASAVEDELLGNEAFLDELSRRVSERIQLSQ